MIIMLSDLIKEDLVAKIKTSSAFSLLTDEVTDISNIQQLLTFLRYYGVEKGTTETCFANTSNLLAESATSAADSESIFLSLQDLIKNELSLDLKDLKAFCSDGASVMTGKNSGVAAKFRQLDDCNTMINVHCICHRLALACGDTGNELKFISDFELTLTQLWIFFKNSPKRLTIYIKTAMQLKNFEHLPQKEQNMVVKRVKKAVCTRWLSLHASVDSVHAEYAGLLHTLRLLKDEKTAGGASASGILKKLDDKRFLAALYMLKFTLPHLSVLSKTFQTGELNFSRIKPAIEKAKYKLRQVV